MNFIRPIGNYVTARSASDSSLSLHVLCGSSSSLASREVPLGEGCQLGTVLMRYRVLIVLRNSQSVIPVRRVLGKQLLGRPPRSCDPL